MIVIGTGEVFLFLVATIIFLFLVNDSSKKLSKSIEEKEKENSELEDFASHMLRCQNLNDYVKDVIDTYLKNEKSIGSFPKFFFRIICENVRVYELFNAEIVRVMSERKDIYESSERNSSDINKYALELSALNCFLQKIQKTREGYNSARVVPYWVD